MTHPHPLITVSTAVFTVGEGFKVQVTRQERTSVSDETQTTRWANWEAFFVPGMVFASGTVADPASDEDTLGIIVPIALRKLAEIQAAKTTKPGPTWGEWTPKPRGPLSINNTQKGA